MKEREIVKISQKAKVITRLNFWEFCKAIRVYIEKWEKDLGNG
jgi:hypothetical protein